MVALCHLKFAHLTLQKRVRPMSYAIEMPIPETADDFARITGRFKESTHYRPPLLFAIGSQVTTSSGLLASARFPVVNGPSQNTGTAAILMNILGIEPHGAQTVRITDELLTEALRYFEPFSEDGKRHLNLDALRAARRRIPESPSIVTFIFDDIDPQGVENSTLKLYGMSNRLFRPNTLNLTKIFTKLPNVAWVNDRPIDEEGIDEALMNAAFGDGSFAPYMVDKFPLYIHRINSVKMGVRITDQHKVRLGAYLGEGTTLMPGASYVNFNAGTDGASMVEGRISSAAFIGKGTDVGGGASMLGTLSGGNNRPISTGRNCLLEANCVLGIPLGDACIVAADTAILSSSIVHVTLAGHPAYGRFVKGVGLAGVNGVTFRRNDKEGHIEMVRTARNEEFARKLEDGEPILNADLHRNH